MNDERFRHLALYEPQIRRNRVRVGVASVPPAARGSRLRACQRQGHQPHTLTSVADQIAKGGERVELPRGEEIGPLKESVDSRCLRVGGAQAVRWQPAHRRGVRALDTRRMCGADQSALGTPVGVAPLQRLPSGRCVGARPDLRRERTIAGQSARSQVAAVLATVPSLFTAARRVVADLEPHTTPARRLAARHDRWNDVRLFSLLLAEPPRPNERHVNSACWWGRLQFAPRSRR